MEASWLLYAAYILGGYLLGSILFGSILPKTIKGIDITVCSRDGTRARPMPCSMQASAWGCSACWGIWQKGFCRYF